MANNSNSTILTEYWNVSTTISEYSSSIEGRYTTEALALAKLATCHDWYGYPGSGRIYRVRVIADTNGEISIEEMLAYESDGIHPVRKII